MPVVLLKTLVSLLSRLLMAQMLLVSQILFSILESHLLIMEASLEPHRLQLLIVLSILLVINIVSKSMLLVLVRVTTSGLHRLLVLGKLLTSTIIYFLWTIPVRPSCYWIKPCNVWNSLNFIILQLIMMIDLMLIHMTKDNSLHKMRRDLYPKIVFVDSLLILPNEIEVESKLLSE